MRINTFSAIVASVALFSGETFAANSSFTDEASFLSASGATQIEGFEQLSARLRSTDPIATTLLTVTPESARIGIQNGSNSPEEGFGSFAVAGSQYLFSYNKDLPSGTLHFVMASPTQVFGLSMTDVGEASGTVSLRTNVGAFAGGVTLATYASQGPNGSLAFFGITQDASFTEAYLTVTGTDEAFGVDSVRIAAVPEPAEYALLLAGLGLVGAAAKRRGRTQ